MTPVHITSIVYCPFPKDWKPDQGSEFQHLKGKIRKQTYLMNSKTFQINIKSSDLAKIITVNGKEAYLKNYTLLSCRASKLVTLYKLYI